MFIILYFLSVSDIATSNHVLTWWFRVGRLATKLVDLAQSRVDLAQSR